MFYQKIAGVLKFQFLNEKMFSNESDSKSSFSRSRSIGSKPGAMENLAEFEMSRIRNEQT